MSGNLNFVIEFVIGIGCCRNYVCFNLVMLKLFFIKVEFVDYRIGLGLIMFMKKKS